MSVTIEEVAKAAGFSIATVSRVLAKSDYPVKLATRQRILAVAQAVGYRPNMTARSLRTDQTNTVGIIVDDLLSPFVPAIVRGIQDYLNPFDYLNLIINSDWDPEIEQAARTFPASVACAWSPDSRQIAMGTPRGSAVMSTNARARLKC